jgi:hypothetical protein
VIQHVREKFSCRACEAITQPPAPSHPIARGRAGPKLLAHILFSKYGLHLPLNRQSDTYEREGIDLDVSTLADWVGAAAATLMPLVDVIRAHVLAAERIHADDTTVPVLAKGKTRTGRLWTYVRDDRPFVGPDPPAAVFFYSRDRGGEHPEQHLASYAGLMQADAYAGFNRLYEANRKPGPIVEAACWAHARRKFFDLARINKAPIAIEAVERIDAPPAEHEQMPVVRIALERLLHHERQAIKTLAHVRVAGRQPNPCAARDRDHRRRLLLASAFISVATVGASTGPVSRIRPPVANSISMTPARAAGGGDATSGSGVTATGLKAAGICARSQSCWRQRNNWLA